MDAAGLRADLIINCVQFGIYSFEKTLDLVAFPWPGIFFQAADQVLLARKEHCYARHRGREFGMLVHWSESHAALSRQQGGRPWDARSASAPKWALDTR